MPDGDQSLLQSMRGDPSVWRLRAACFTQVLVVALLFPFESLWMRENGLTETPIGILMGVGTIVFFLANLGWGALADRTHKPNIMAMSGFFAIGGVLIYFANCSQLWHFALYVLLIGSTSGLLNSMMPLLAVSVLGDAGLGRRYGFYRVFGSFGWIVGTLVIANLAPNVRSTILLGALAAMIGPFTLMGLRVTPPPERHYVSPLRVLRNRELMVFYVAVFFYAMAIPALFRFLSLHATHLGASKEFVGVMMSINGFVAMIGLPLAGVLVDRMGCRALILIAMIAQPLRVACYAPVTSHLWLLPPQTLHVVTWAGLEVAGMIYVSRVALPGNRATAMALFVGTQTLSQGVSSPLTGYLAEHFGYPTMYVVIASLVSVGLVVFAANWILHPRSQSHREQPDASPG